LFHGQWFSDWTFKAETMEAGWLVTPTYLGPPGQMIYFGPIELIMEDGVLREVRHRAYGYSPRESLPNDDAAASAPGWGEAVEGFSVSLRREPPQRPVLPDSSDFRLTVRNLGSETIYVPESQELGQLEVDGVWYSWSDPYFVARKPLPPGRSFVDIAVGLVPFWHSDAGQSPPSIVRRVVRSDSRTNGHYLAAESVGKHTIRYAVLARRGEQSGRKLTSLGRAPDPEGRRE
jgi:hypothetical protein